MTRRQDGFGLVEVLMAITIIAIGLLSVVGVLNMARKLTLVAERQTTLAHRAQQELERVTALPYAQIALTATPSHSSDPANPDYYVNGSSFQYDRTDATKHETLDVDPGGVLTPNGTDGSTSTWQDGRLSGKVYTFVTWHYDAVCGSGSTALCSTSQDYKRVTVMVTLDHATHPSRPVVASTIVADPKAAPNGYTSGTTNPLRAPDAACLNGSGVQTSCTGDLNGGTPITYFLTDSPYTSGYSPPTTGNNDHCTILAILGCPKPDQLITSVPPTAGTQPPCFSLDLGCLTGGGLKLPHPSTDASSCGSPPSDNTRAHSWVAPSVPVGTTVNLTGAGGMTAYLQSASAVNVNVKLCLAAYIEPAGVLGLLTGSLLGTQIGATVTANVQASAGVPTPVSFQFNLGSAAQLTSTALSVVRLQLVVWLAASAGTDVALVYDHPQFASQVELMAK